MPWGGLIWAASSNITMIIPNHTLSTLASLNTGISIGRVVSIME